MKSEKIDTITIKIPHSVTKKLDKIALEEDRTRSSVMRMAFAKFLEEYNEEKWAQKAIAEYKKDGGSKQAMASLEEVMKKLNISKKDLLDNFSDCD